MKIFLNIIFIILAVILQISLLPKIALFGAFPNLLLLIMLGLLLIDRSQEAIYWAGLGGILLDFFSPSYFGFYTLSLLVVFFAAFILVKKIFSQLSWFLVLGLVILSSLAAEVVFLVVDYSFSSLIVYFLDAFFNGLLGCLIYLLLKYYYSPKESIKI